MSKYRILEDHDDGLILYFLTGKNKYASIEWYNSGEVVLLLSDRETKEIIAEEITDIPSTLRRIKEYVNA